MHTLPTCCTTPWATSVDGRCLCGLPLRPRALVRRVCRVWVPCHDGLSTPPPTPTCALRASTLHRLWFHCRTEGDDMARGPPAPPGNTCGQRPAPASWASVSLQAWASCWAVASRCASLSFACAIPADTGAKDNPPQVPRERRTRHRPVMASHVAEESGEGTAGNMTRAAHEPRVYAELRLPTAPS